MSYWNYRLVKDKRGYISVREVFYNNNDEIWGLTSLPIHAGAGGDEDDTDEEVVKEIEFQLEKMLKDVRSTRNEIIIEDGFKFAERTDLEETPDKHR